jgi:hypothetical protein
VEVSVGGFESTQKMVQAWSISLFEAATKHAYDAAADAEMTTTEILTRYSELDGILFRALDRCTEVANASNGDAAAMVPGLYQILTFLSRLSANEGGDEKVRSVVIKRLSIFIETVKKCASFANLSIRMMAAQVLGSIVSREESVKVLTDVASLLPAVTDKTNDVGFECQRDGKAVGITMEHVHGILLQAYWLTYRILITEADDASGDEMADAYSQYLVTVFLDRYMWLSTKRVTDYTVRAVVIDIVETLLEYELSQAVASPDVLAAIEETVEPSCVGKIDFILAMDPAKASRPQGAFKYNRSVVLVFFSLFRLYLKTRKGQELRVSTWFSRVEQLLQCRIVEVRKRAFKQLIKFLHNSGFRLENERATADSLHSVLLNQLQVETENKILARLLHLLVDFQDDLHSQMPTPVKTTTVTTISKLVMQSTDVDVTANALELLSAFLRDRVIGTEAVVTLRDAVVRRASTSQHIRLRLAGAYAIDRSEMLQARTVEIRVDGWMCALRLLQDDSEEVRGVIRSVVQRCLRAADQTIKVDEFTSETVLLSSAVDFVVNKFAATTYGRSAIRSTLMDAIDAAVLLEDYHGPAPVTDADRCEAGREAESCQRFYEPELHAQLLLLSLLKSNVTLTPLKAELLDKNIQVLQLVLANCDKERWIEIVVQDAAVFPVLSSCFTAGVAVLSSLTRSERRTLQARLTKLGDVAGKVLPLVSTAQAHPTLVSALQALAQPEAASDAHAEVLRGLVHLSPSWKPQH